MSFPARPDEDMPDGTDPCGHARAHGFVADLYECRSENGLYYRLILGNNIEFDIHPERILLRHGSVKMEVRDDKIVTHAPVLEHHGDMTVTGTITAGVDVIAGAEEISLVHHRHWHDFFNGLGFSRLRTGKPRPVGEEEEPEEPEEPEDPEEPEEPEEPEAP